MRGSSHHRRPAEMGVAALIAISVVVLQVLLVPLFAAPAANLAPRDLPILVAGPAPVADSFIAALERAEPGAFKIATVPTATAADRALRNHDAYAAFVLDPSGLSLHTASGAGPTVAALLTQASTQLGHGRPVPVVDVVPGDPDDPRGAGFASGFLPLALTGLVAGIALAVAVRSRTAKLVGLLGFSLLAGLGAAAVLQFWLGVLPGSYLLNAAAVGLFVAATSATVAGLAAILGSAGIGLGALLVFLIGNPLSAVASAPELLPQPWGTVGQYLPVGAGGSLLRSTAFFDGAGGALPLWVLVAYAIGGLVLILVGRATVALPSHGPDRSLDEGAQPRRRRNDRAEHATTPIVNP